MIPNFLVGSKPRVAVLRLQGVVAASGRLSSTLDFRTAADAIERAFKLMGAKAVALIINSPGGSPVQSRQIHDRIRALAEEKKLPVYVFVEDVAASGGYMLACAGDHIFADASSIVGSIGVISAGFGFHNAMDRIGVERRIYTAGESKSMLDPFQPERSEDVEHLKTIQTAVHEQFKTLVRERRGARLQENQAEESLMDGRFWAGERALELGLIDGLGDARTILRERYGKEVKLIPVAMKKRGLFGRTFRPGVHGGAATEAWVGTALETLEERAMWGRFGL
jgi:signal peptide peptidase SppA